jgi:hypothetical protein
MKKPMTPPGTDRRNVSAMLSIAALTSSRMRIPRVVVHHPVLSGDRNFLRDLRAAEMAAWEAGLSLTEYRRTIRNQGKARTTRSTR